MPFRQRRRPRALSKWVAVMRLILPTSLHTPTQYEPSFLQIERNTSPYVYDPRSSVINVIVSFLSFLWEHNSKVDMRYRHRQQPRVLRRCLTVVRITLPTFYKGRSIRVHAFDGSKQTGHYIYFYPFGVYLFVSIPEFDQKTHENLSDRKRRTTIT